MRTVRIAIYILLSIGTLFAVNGSITMRYQPVLLGNPSLVGSSISPIGEPYGFFNFNLVAFILGKMSIWIRVVYAIIGIAAVIMIIMKFGCGKCCCKSKQP